MGFRRCNFSNLWSKFNFERGQINIAKFNEKCIMDVCSRIFCVNDFIIAVKIAFGVTLVKHVRSKSDNLNEKCVFFAYFGDF